MAKAGPPREFKRRGQLRRNGKESALSDAACPPPNVGRNGVATAVPHLRRVLSPWDLIVYGIVSVIPSAPVTVFSLPRVMSHGHAVDTILI
jgi:hypothetical protein